MSTKIRFRVAVRLGEHAISTAVDCAPNGKCLDPVQDIPIAERIKHGSYGARRKINDIGLLKLQFAADTSKRNVRTICLPTTAESQIEQIDEAARESMLITGRQSNHAMYIGINFIF